MAHLMLLHSAHRAVRRAILAAMLSFAVLPSPVEAADVLPRIVNSLVTFDYPTLRLHP